jgi:predicted phage tail protein
MRRRIHLMGPLAALHPGPIEVIAETVWDAIEAVSCQIKGLQPDPIRGRRVLQVVDYPTVEKLRTPDDVVDIFITPALLFGKEGGVIQTIIGTVLVVVGFALGGPTNPWGLFFIQMGAGMIIGGLIQILTPQPQLGGANDEDVRSRYLPGIQNTVRIGTTKPLLLGRRRIGGHILSMNIDAKDTGL